MADVFFTCEMCKGTFPKGWTDEDAQAEREDNGWVDTPDEDMCVICDVCYKKVMAGRAGCEEE